MTSPYNYRHLYYFWVVAKEGSMSKAAERLDMAIQTISTQVHDLEKSLGHLLFKPSGRGLALTDQGIAALNVADQIFSIGEKLPEILRDASKTPRKKLTVGIADGLPKLVTRQLLQPIFNHQSVQVVALEGNFENLLANLALHKLDLVLADRAVPDNKNLKLYSDQIDQSPVDWYASHHFFSKAKKRFPACLNELPILLPTQHSSVRVKIDQWFEKNNITPQILGEFEDSALLKTFGASGVGILPAPNSVDADLNATYQLRSIGACKNVYEYFYAIRAEKKIANPLIEAIIKHNKTVVP